MNDKRLTPDQVESSILLSGIFQPEEESGVWARGLRYEKSGLPGTTASGKKVYTFSQRDGDAAPDG